MMGLDWTKVLIASIKGAYRALGRLILWVHMNNETFHFIVNAVHTTKRKAA